MLRRTPSLRSGFQPMAWSLSGFQRMKMSKGGSCRVMESRRIIINKHLPANEKISLLARELGRFDVAALDLPDQVRKKILHESDRTAGALKLSA